MGEGRIKQQITVLTIVVAFIAGLMATWNFYISTRPCRVDVPPGTIVTYRLDIEQVPVDARGRVQGEALRTSVDILLWGIGDNGEVALVAPRSPGRDRTDELTQMLIHSNGSMERLDGAGRPLEVGRSISLFDFNLLPLPRGGEQRWTATPAYAVLPTDSRRVEVKVQRTHGGSDPRFRMEMPTVPWINDQGRYDQIKDLVSEYRFNRDLGLIDEAEISCVFGREGSAGDDRRYRYTMTLTLEDMRAVEAPEEHIAMRDLALAIDSAQVFRQRGAEERYAESLRRIRECAVDDPALARLARTMTGAVEAPDDHVATPRRWLLRVGLFLRTRAERGRSVAATLREEGYPAAIRPYDDELLGLYLGPYERRQNELQEQMAQRFSSARPTWVEAEER